MSGPPRGPVGLLACTAGIALANNYAIQPALGDVARDTGTSAAAIGLVTTAALVGCIVGFAFLLPLADRAAPRRLVTGQLAMLATGLLLAAAARGLWLLLAAYVIIGAGASVSAQSSTIAGRAVPGERRGTAVALVAAGMSAGILLSRLIGGALAHALGWRGMLLVFAGLVLVCAMRRVAAPAGRPARAHAQLSRHSHRAARPPAPLPCPAPRRGGRQPLVLRLQPRLGRPHRAARPAAVRSRRRRRRSLQPGRLPWASPRCRSPGASATASALVP